MPKISIHIDGGYFLKRLPDVRPDFEKTVDNAVKAIIWTISGHLKNINKIHNLKNERALLYRVFYYDARPFEGQTHKPISKKFIDFNKSDEAIFRRGLFERLRKEPNVALRLGKVHLESKWSFTQNASDDLRRFKIDLSEIDDKHFKFGLKQKGVDMRLGLDIASVVLKKQANIIVLLTGDSDFVPASKLARREGAQIILDPMHRNVSDDLFEHIDGLHNGLGKGRKGPRIT
jgi:uncharacterized LabA/DUF88 family protein